MQYVPFGKHGFDVSRLGFGCMRLPTKQEGEQRVVDQEAAIALIRGAQACAMLDDRDFVLPEDVQHMFLPVMAHRMILSPEAKMKGFPAEQFLLTILQNTTVPVRL